MEIGSQNILMKRKIDGDNTMPALETQQQSLVVLAEAK